VKFDCARFDGGEAESGTRFHIGSVSVERVLPRTLKISVTERDPVAQVNIPRAGAAGGIAVEVFQLDATAMSCNAGSACV